MPIIKEPTPQQERVRPLPLVGVALGSLVAGFLIVYALGQSAAQAPGERGSRSGRPEAVHPAAAPPRDVPAPTPATPSPAPATTPEPTPAPAPEATPAPAPATPAAAVPSSRGSTIGEAFYFRCWEAGQDDPAPEGTCDRLPALEQRIAAQLPEIEACASGATGTLSLGVEVQVRARQASYWAGRRSTVTPVEPLIRCVRTRLADTDLGGLEGRFRKYTLFVPIELR